VKDMEFKNSLLTNNLDLDYIEILLRQKFLLGSKDEKFYIIEKYDN
jgi:cell division protein DivIC